jgi:hypothetical protein
MMTRLWKIYLVPTRRECGGLVLYPAQLGLWVEMERGKHKTTQDHEPNTPTSNLKPPS